MTHVGNCFALAIDIGVIASTADKKALILSRGKFRRMLLIEDRVGLHGILLPSKGCRLMTIRIAMSGSTKVRVGIITKIFFCTI